MDSSLIWVSVLCTAWGLVTCFIAESNLLSQGLFFLPSPARCMTQEVIASLNSTKLHLHLWTPLLWEAILLTLFPIHRGTTWLLTSETEELCRLWHNTVAHGNFSQKIAIPMQGIVMATQKGVINTMVDEFGQFATQVAQNKTKNWISL